MQKKSIKSVLLPSRKKFGKIYKGESKSGNGESQKSGESMRQKKRRKGGNFSKENLLPL